MSGGVVASVKVVGAVVGPRSGVHLGAKQGQDMYLAEHMLDVPIVIRIHLHPTTIMNEDR
jgi:hypothetical protein